MLNNSVVQALAKIAAVTNCCAVTDSDIKRAATEGRDVVDVARDLYQFALNNLAGEYDITDEVDWWVEELGKSKPKDVRGYFPDFLDLGLTYNGKLLTEVLSD